MHHVCHSDLRQQPKRRRHILPPLGYAAEGGSAARFGVYFIFIFREKTFPKTVREKEPAYPV